MEWELSDIINAVSSLLLLIAIVVALLIGLNSLRLTKRLEEKKYRIQLLTEISKWGIDVLADCWRIGIKEMEKSGFPDLKFSSWRDIGARTGYIRSIAVIFKSKIEEIIDDIEDNTMFTHNLIIALHDGITALRKDQIKDVKKLGVITFSREGKKVKLKDMTNSNALCVVTIKTQFNTQILLDKINDLMVAELKK